MAPHPLHVRRAAAQDLEQLARLFDQYRSFYGMPPDLPLALGFLGERMSKGESVILVAETQPAELAGFTQLYPGFSSVSAAAVYVLNDLYVSPHHRGRGAGRALLEAARQFAEQAGALRLLLSTARTNRSAQALYESLGWVRDLEFCHYSLELRPGATP